MTRFERDLGGFPIPVRAPSHMPTRMCSRASMRSSLRSSGPAAAPVCCHSEELPPNPGRPRTIHYYGDTLSTGGSREGEVSGNGPQAEVPGRSTLSTRTPPPRVTDALPPPPPSTTPSGEARAPGRMLDRRRLLLVYKYLPRRKAFHRYGRRLINL